MPHRPTVGTPYGTDSGGGARSIGAVLRVLSADFPEVTVSRIRFLESEGLVVPRRSPSGCRKFRDEDVQRLRYVLRMQRDHHLPLRVIRERLDRGGPPGDEAAAVSAPEPPAAPHPPIRVGREELLAAGGVAEAELAEWEAYGLSCADDEGLYDLDQAAVLRLMADLGRHGLEPRHLRVVKAAAERHADLVEQLIAPLRRHRSPQQRARAEATARELVTLSARLHTALVRSALNLRST